MAGQVADFLGTLEDLPGFRIHGHRFPVSVVNAADVAALNGFAQQLFIPVALRQEGIGQAFFPTIDGQSYHRIKVKTGDRGLFHGGVCRSAAA